MIALVDSVAYWLADYTLCTTALLVVALGAMAACRQPAKRLAVAKAALVAVAMLAALCALPGWSIASLGGNEATESTVAAPVAAEAPMADVPRPIEPIRLSAPMVAPVPKDVVPAATNWDVPWLALVVGAYLVGSTAVAIWLVAGAMAAARLVRRAETALAAEWESIAAAAGVARLRISREIDVPVALGVWRPCVLLPSEWIETRSAGELATVLAHEAAHVRNGDLIWLAVSRTLSMVLWAQPLYWWLRRTMRLDQETLADAAAAELSSRVTYAEQLVAWARAMPPRSRPALASAVGLWEGPSQLRRRISILLDERLTVLRECSRRLQVLSFVCCMTAAVGLSVVTLGQVQSDSQINEVDSGAGAEIDTQGTEGSDVPPGGEYTVPIEVAGYARDVKGEPIAGARIYLAAPRSNSRPLAMTITDDQGEYRFEEVKLPVERADTNGGKDVGAFEVFGVADGYGFAWRPLKWFYPNSDHMRDQIADPTWDLPDRYGRNDSISLDLQFGPPATLRGRIVNDRGEPIPGATLAIRDGMPWGDEWSLRDLESFNERALVPASIKLRQSDAAGRFEFTQLPAGHEFSIDIRPPVGPPRRIQAATLDVPRETDGALIYSGDFEVVFPRPRSMKLRVVLGDTDQPAVKVGIGGNVAVAGFWETTNEQGEVDVMLPDGAYNLSVSPRFGTPYLKTSARVVVSKETAERPTTIRLRPAAVVDVTVVDDQTGEPLSGVDVWLQQGDTHRSVHGYRSWEVESRISHYTEPRTDDRGKMRVLFEPGIQRIGVGLEAYPVGYEPVEVDGVSLDLIAGKSRNIEFHLRRSFSGLEDHAVVEDRYVLCRVTTDLQRSLLGDAAEPVDDASACLIVNTAAFAEESLNEESPALNELAKRLATWAKADNRRLKAQVILRPSTGDEASTKLREFAYALAKHLEVMGTAAGFRHATWGVTHLSEPSFGWRAFIENAETLAEDAATDSEQGIGDARVRVFAVRTFLSHLLTNADCVVDIMPIIEEAEAKSFPREFEPEISEFVPQLEYGRKDTLLLRVRSTLSVGERLHDWVNDIQGRELFAASLGFETCNLSTSYVADSDAEAEAEKHSEEEVETRHAVVPGGNGFVTFTVANAARPWDYKPNVLALALEDVAGNPLQGISVAVYRSPLRTGGHDEVARAITNERGEVEFANLVPATRAQELSAIAAKGEFPLTRGDHYFVVLRRDGLATVILPAWDFDLASRGVKRRVRMRPAEELSGRVTDRDGEAVAGAIVAAGGASSYFVMEGANAVRTDSDGRYRFTDRVAFDRQAANAKLEERNQFMTAAAPDMSKLYPEVYDPAEDTAVSDLVVTHPDFAVTAIRGGDVPGETNVVMAPPAAIEGRVERFGSGEPVAGVRIEAFGAPMPIDRETTAERGEGFKCIFRNCTARRPPLARTAATC